MEFKFLKPAGPAVAAQAADWTMPPAAAQTSAWRVRIGLVELDLNTGAPLLIALTLALIALALAMPVNHDEDQYLAATVLAAHWRPFADFLYLQTPLQPLVTAPLAALFPGHSFLVLRLASAVLGGATLAFAYASQRRLGVSRANAGISIVLMASCYTFQFSNAVFRNDALPTLLLTASLLAAFAGLRAGRLGLPSWLTCGLLLGASMSAKISFALPLAAAGLFLLVDFVRTTDRRAPMLRILAFGVGATAGLLPTALAFIAAPEQFTYGVFGYFAHAPEIWYRSNGLGGLMGLGGKLVSAAANLAIGPALAALVIAAAASVRDWRTAVLRSRPELLFLDMMIVGGLIAALLPTPTYRQYFMPLLPPLFVRLALELPRLRAAMSSKPTLAAAALSLGLMIGLGHFAYVVGGAALTQHWAVSRVTEEAHWIGDRLRAAGARGQVATLSPDVALDSGYPLDRRFATGVFVYRTGDDLDPATVRRLHVLSPSTLAASLDRSPPAAIVTGYERGDLGFKIHPDDGLQAYARSRGYRLETSPWGAAQLYIRPVDAARDGAGRTQP